MAHEDALQALQKQTTFLNHADNHVGDTIQTLRNMQDQELMDIQDGFENRLRFLQLAKDLDDQGLGSLAAIARDGAALEEQQIERNQQLIKDQGVAIELLTFLAGGLNRFRTFATRITRAFQNFFAE